VQNDELEVDQLFCVHVGIRNSGFSLLGRRVLRLFSSGTVVFTRCINVNLGAGAAVWLQARNGLVFGPVEVLLDAHCFMRGQFTARRTFV